MAQPWHTGSAMATIQPRKATNGRTRFRAQVRLLGFPSQTATFDRKTDAKAWAQATEAAMREGRYFPARESKRHTVAELVDRRLEWIRDKRPQAHRQQKQILGWWKAQLGPYALSQLTPALIAEYRDALLKENIGTKESPAHRGAATANRFLAALSSACTDAVKEWHWLQENPLRRVSKESEPSGRVRYLSTEERNALLEACRKSELKELYLIVLLALTTGMRRGEVIGLHWSDVDLARKSIVLHKTKNQERRSVPILPAVMEALKDHNKVRRLNTELVFPGPGDSPIHFDVYWRDALATAKIKDFRFHDLRHTAASYLAMSGATTAEIAAVLGHKTLQMVKRYAHLSDQHVGAVIERMSKKYFEG
jgi:integrase